MRRWRRGYAFSRPPPLHGSSALRRKLDCGQVHTGHDLSLPGASIPARHPTRPETRSSVVGGCGRRGESRGNRDRNSQDRFGAAAFPQQNAWRQDKMGKRGNRGAVRRRARLGPVITPLEWQRWRSGQEWLIDQFSPTDARKADVFRVVDRFDGVSTFGVSGREEMCRRSTCPEVNPC